MNWIRPLRPGLNVGPRCLIAALVTAGAMLVALAPAEARCVHSGQIYSCTVPRGKPIMMSCFGVSRGLLSCIDFSGKTVLVGQHWKNQVKTVPDSTDTESDTSTQLASSADAAAADALFDSQLSSALEANASKSTTSTSASSTTRKKQR
jgi:hypothetical protein